MDADELKLRQLAGQFLLAPSAPVTVGRALCGLQAQFMKNALHALAIRSGGPDPALVRRLFCKSWTLRGTVHIFPADELPLYLDERLFRDDGWDAPSFWNQRPDWPLTPARQQELSALIRRLLAAGPLPREALKRLCRENGMTAAEEAGMFHPWGGGVRELCERGFVHYLAQEEKVLALSPAVRPLPEAERETILARRYFTHYAPATIHDAMYFFHTGAGRVKSWLAKLPVRETVFGGRTYFSLDGPEPAGDLPECLFLAGFDPLLLGHEKRESLFLEPDDRRAVFTLSGLVRPVLLLHGRAAGVWKQSGKQFRVTPFRPLGDAERAAVHRAADALWPQLRTLTIE